MQAVQNSEGILTPDSVDELLGATLGRYRIEELLGRGNRAGVYRATETASGQTVALRVFDRDLGGDRAFTDRFKHMVTVVAAVRHPHLLPIIEHGRHDGHAYVARPYVAGGTLRNLLGTPLAPADAIRLLGPVAAALDHAHHYAVVHGDVKPGNILLQAPGHPVLAELGIAQLLPRENTLILAAKGRHYGTVEYLAPEQAQGVPPESRTDVYALGVVLYEMLTGRPPFRADDAEDTPRAIAMRHVMAAPPAPRGLNPLLGEAVEQVLLRALAKNPDQRYPSCGTLIAALEEACAADPLPSPAPAPTPAQPRAVAALPTPPGYPVAADGVAPPRPREAPAPARERQPGPPAAGPTPGTVDTPDTQILVLPEPTQVLAGQAEAERRLEQAEARHLAELRAVRQAYEARLAAQAEQLRGQEAEVAALKQRATQAERERTQLATRVEELRRERDALEARARQLEEARAEVMRALAQGSGPAAPAPRTPAARGATPAKERQPEARLLVVDYQRIGLPEGTAFTLRHGMVVGRRDGVDIQLGDNFVSAEHARLTREGGRWWVTDLGTTNGTFVNGARIVRPTELSAGDEVRFGQVRTRFA